MTLSSPAAIVYRKHTFLSAVALGFSAIVIAVIVSGTVIVLYGVHLAGEKSERVITLAQSAIHGLPEFAESLPPALSDMLDDRRQPDSGRAFHVAPFAGRLLSRNDQTRIDKSQA